jgi:hypothetical protein
MLEVCFASVGVLASPISEDSSLADELEMADVVEALFLIDISLKENPLNKETLVGWLMPDMGTRAHAGLLLRLAAYNTRPTTLCETGQLSSVSPSRSELRT